MTKLSNDELRTIGIYQWPDIQNKYVGGDLMIGNGFSIRISAKLNYASLFEKFIEDLSQPNRTTFTQFDTTNFELILENTSVLILLKDIQLVRRK